MIHTLILVQVQPKLTQTTYLKEAQIYILAQARADIVNDTNPNSGGNLDVNGRQITSASSGNIGPIMAQAKYNQWN